MDLVFRTYDEGVAFRYVVPQQQNLSQIGLKEEQSTFFFGQHRLGDAFGKVHHQL